MGNKLKTAASGRTCQRVDRLHRLRALLAIGLLGSQAWSAGAQTLDADIAAGARFAAEHCGACHGATGQSVAPNFPRLAGQNETYLAKQLKDFASGDRKSPLMKEKVAMMDDRMIRSLAAHYASQKAANTPSDDAQLMAVGRFVYERGNVYAGLPACLSCHDTQGRGSANMPRLAGQHPGYIETQLLHFHQRARSNDSAVMTVISSRLSPLETKAVAAYLGNLK
ncbi:MAG TPA: cytochrome c, class I [Hydrogenophaga sp.]|uniref:c-type cytochrome n=1 Tax=Hydrogenophaga sp. TaxID=1904254 RepID=UPI000AECF874|nr:c-type cytochrome [Hydrogenophaga sp.]HAX21045.1 cytochrome c, class I [Hydrogenophaga sp.]HBU19462.1 cytochrome c, class I [Hydrogenophaga sp.]